jgi:ATP-dependent Clp protease adapter protein ClpS
MCSQSSGCEHFNKGNKVMANAHPETKQHIKVNHALQEPPMYKIIYMNDEVTTMEFVVGSLIEYFNYNPDTATTITKDIMRLQNKKVLK